MSMYNLALAHGNAMELERFIGLRFGVQAALLDVQPPDSDSQASILDDVGFTPAVIVVFEPESNDELRTMVRISNAILLELPGDAALMDHQVALLRVGNEMVRNPAAALWETTGVLSEVTIPFVEEVLPALP